MARAVIFANGLLPDQEKARGLLRPNDVMMCADGGYRHLRALGLRPHTVIGDLDSLSEVEVAGLSASGIQLNRHPAEKDQTDLELALRFAADSGFDPILLVAALGGRTDQTIANLGLLANPAFASQELRMDDGIEEILPCRDSCEVHGARGDTVSLIPWGGIAGGVHTENLKWALHADYLAPHETRWISNVMLEEHASIRVSFGLLLVIHRRAERREDSG